MGVPLLLQYHSRAAHMPLTILSWVESTNETLAFWMFALNPSSVSTAQPLDLRSKTVSWTLSAQRRDQVGHTVARTV
jgi:hypothetical protein